MCVLGSKVIPLALRHRQNAGTAATRIGRIFTTTTFYPCRISGSIRGLPRGTWRSTAFPWHFSIPISPKISSSFFCANGTCTQTANSPPTNGPSATLTLLFIDRKSTRLNSSHSQISYAVFCLKKKNSSLTTSCQVCNNNPITGGFQGQIQKESV